MERLRWWIETELLWTPEIRDLAESTVPPSLEAAKKLPVMQAINAARAIRDSLFPPDEDTDGP